MSVIISGIEYNIGDIHNLSEIINIYRNSNNRLMFRVRCIKCGKEKNIYGSEFRFDKYTSCLCQSKTHGMSNTKPYSVYANMKDRCNRSTHPEYHNYGGKGVMVCDEWSNSFEAFYNWAMDNGYKSGLTIDRIDENGNYEPNNCQWITRSENTIKANKTCQHRKANKGRYYGISPDNEYYEFDNASEFGREHGINGQHIRHIAGESKSHKSVTGWEFGYVNS